MCCVQWGHSVSAPMSVGSVVKLRINSLPVQRFFQIVAWLLVLAIIALSVGPPSTRPVTGAGNNFEHVLIFVATGGAFGLGYPRRIWLLPLALLAFSGAVELAQMMVAGRHARLSDFLTDAAASWVGIGLSFILLKLAAVITKD
jgi:VanZ family protein